MQFFFQNRKGILSIRLHNLTRICWRINTSFELGLHSSLEFDVKIVIFPLMTSSYLEQGECPVTTYKKGCDILFLIRNDM